jgi:D-galactarolactone cycloisomerase
MNAIDRRAFIASLSCLTIAASPAVRGPDGLFRFPADDKPTVDFSRTIRAPVVLDRLELIGLSPDDVFVRAISRNGTQGIVKANARLLPLISLFKDLVVPALLGYDAREMEGRIAALANREYKYLSLPFWTAVGHAELALWDMMGKEAGVRAVEMMGGAARQRIPIYLSSLDRDTTPEEEVAWLSQAVERTGGKAMKLKIGGRMSRNADAAPGRQERLVALARKRFGDAMTIHVDANGSFDQVTALRVAEMLEANGVGFFEEPCPWTDFEMTAAVTAAVDRAGMRLRIAGGEQDSAMETWRWYLSNRGLHVLQPDLFYNGGLLRALKLARMAASAGVPVTPHWPRNGVEAAELIHLAAHIPNLFAQVEYRGRPPAHRYAASPVIAPVDGALSLPPGPGFGITFDPAIFVKGRRLDG